MPVVFSIGAIKVNSVNDSSVFSVGQNIIIGFTSGTTNNQGTGQSFGDGIIQPASRSVGFDGSTAIGNQVSSNTPLAKSQTL